MVNTDSIETTLTEEPKSGGNWRNDLKIGYVCMNRNPSVIDHISVIRWVELAKAFGRLGYKVELISNEVKETKEIDTNVMQRKFDDVDIKAYDILKTNYPTGARYVFDNGGHDFHIARLAHVVLSSNPSFHKEKDIHELQWYEKCQQEISKNAKLVGLTTQAYEQLWEQHYDSGCIPVIAPTGVPGYRPQFGGENPFTGNNNVLYSGDLMVEAFVEMLNKLVEPLNSKGINLYFMGGGKYAGDLSQKISRIPQASFEEASRVQSFADVGIAIAIKQDQESEISKIYHYMWAGTPCVAEEDIANSHILENGKWGFTVPFRNMGAFVENIQRAMEKNWDRDAMTDNAIQKYSWDVIAQRYDTAIKQVLNI